MKVIAITGTGTDIGKTIVTAALASCAMRAGHRVAVVKPVQTGLLPGEPGDLSTVARLTGCADLFEYVRYAEPLAPATAAWRLGEAGPSTADLADRVADLVERNAHDVVLIEGAGGALVRFNARQETFLDLISYLGDRGIASGGSSDDPTGRHPHRLEIALVTTADLGCLHDVAATSLAMQAESCDPDHLIIGSWPRSPGLAERCNLVDLVEYSESFARLRGALPDGAGLLDREAFADLAMRSLTPTLGGRLNAREFHNAYAERRAEPSADHRPMS